MIDDSVVDLFFDQKNERDKEQRFYQQDPGAQTLEGIIQKKQAEAARQRKAMASRSYPPAIDTLVARFDLTQTDREILLLCLAFELDPVFGTLLGYLTNHSAQELPTPFIIQALLDTEDQNGRFFTRCFFLPEASLVRYRLIQLAPDPSGTTASSKRSLILDRRSLSFLLGVNEIDERVRGVLCPVTPSCLSISSHRERLEQLSWIANTDESFKRQQKPILNLTGAPGSGRLELARGLCDRLGIELYTLETQRLSHLHDQRRELLQLLEREIVLLPMALYIEADEIEREERERGIDLDDLVESLSGLLFIGSSQVYPTKRDSLVVPIAKLDVDEQRNLWRQALAYHTSLSDECPKWQGMPHSHRGRGAGRLEGELGSPGCGCGAQQARTRLHDNVQNRSIDELVQQFDFSPRAIHQTIALAAGQSRFQTSKDKTSITPADLWNAARQQAGNVLDALAQRITPCYGWDDIVLPKESISMLEEIANQVANRPRVYEEWGFGAKLSRGKGISALFSGPSGTGKTMAAEVMAGHLELDLYRIDLAGVVSKYIGETEKNLKRVFDAAEQSGAILFFDEADALFGQRTEIKDSHDRYANIEVNYLLQRMEDYKGLSILATNRQSALDQAFLRRLRFLVAFPSPSEKDRRLIWQKVFPAQADQSELDFDALAQLSIAGGHIRNIAINAAFLAASESASINMIHIMRATKQEYEKNNRLISEIDFGPYYNLVKHGAQGTHYRH